MVRKRTFKIVHVFVKSSRQVEKLSERGGEHSHHKSHQMYSNRRRTKCSDRYMGLKAEGSHPSFIDRAQHVREPLLTQMQQHHQVKATADELVLRLHTHTIKD